MNGVPIQMKAVDLYIVVVMSVSLPTVRGGFNFGTIESVMTENLKCNHKKTLHNRYFHVVFELELEI